MIKLADWMKANDYTEVLLWSTDAYMTTMSDAVSYTHLTLPTSDLV